MSTVLPPSPAVVPPTIVTLPGPGDRPGDWAADESPVNQQTLRVLHVVNGEHFSGAERVQSHLGRCLPDHGVTADFASVKPGRFTDQLEQQPGWGQSHRVKMAGRFDLRTAASVVRLVRRHDYNLLHAHTPRTALIASIASTWTGVPWIYHVHSPAARDSSRAIVNRVNAAIERRSLSNCHGIVTVSESLRADCLSLGHDAEKIHVVHNGVPAICPPRDHTPSPGGRWTVAMVALMRPRKGLEVVLDALAKLRRDGHDVVLRCIGPFETEAYHRGIDEQIDRLHLSEFVDQGGFVDDVPAALSKVDAMILPSLYGEGLPMVVLESMAAGLPVVATRVEGTPEAITDGVEGLLAQPNDADSLAGKIADLVTGRHDWSAMSAAAIDRHRDAFSDHAMARKTAEVYRRTLQRIG